MDPTVLALESAPKALVYGGVILSVGAAAARLWLLPRAVAAGVGSATSGQATDARLVRIALFASVALAIGLLWRAWGHTAASFGLAESLVGENLRLVSWESRWGGAWRVQAAAAALLVVLAGTSGPRQFVAPLHALTSLVLCGLLPLMGHAGGEPARVILHAAHVAAAGAWVGTLAATALSARGDAREAMLAAFAPMALAGAGLVGVTGVVAAWTYLQGAWSAVGSPYGVALIVKLALVGDIAVLGFLNWRRYHGGGAALSMGRGQPVAAGRSALVTAEIVTAALVVLVTAVLTELEHP